MPGRVLCNCPAWNEALVLPRPFDHNGRCAPSRSSRTRPTCSTIRTFSTETRTIARKVEELKALAKAEIARIDAMARPSPRSSPVT